MNIYTDKRTGIKYADYVLNGKRIRKSLKTKNKAVALLKAAQLAEDNGKQNQPDILWKDFLSKYEAFIQANRSKNTVDIFKNAKNKLTSWRTFTYLKELTPQVLDELKTHLKNNAKSSYVAGINRSIRALKTMMRQAEKWALISPQKWEIVSKFKEPKGRIEFHSTQEIAAILSHLNKDWQIVVLLGVRAGLRRGEMAALRWADVDFKNNQLYIAPNKTEKYRFVPMSQDLRAALLNAQKRAKNDFVVTVGDPSARQSQYFLSVAYKKKMAHFEMNGKKIHCFLHKLRHTFASHLVQNGIDLYRVSKLLGHSSITMTEIYAHLAPADLQTAILSLPQIPHIDTKKNADSK